jgi:phage regulator Rha-like protein
VPVELVERRIYLIRGQKVMLDSDLAELYQVLTKNLNLAVRRNANRFPPDFMFQLTRKEAESLRLQIATSNEGRGGRRYLPYVFTEHGVAMLSSVLNSERAVQMNIVIIRAFLKLREVLATHKDLAERMEQIESSQREHGSIIVHLAKEIKTLKHGPRRKKPRIGFYTGE